MAKTEGAEAESGRGAEKSSGLLGFIISMLVLTVVSGVAGGLFGMYGFGKSDDAVTKKSEKPDHSKQAVLLDALNLRPLSPIITNLASPRGTWIRLEAAIVTDGSLGKEEAVIAGKIAEDVVAFLRTVPLAHIEGANGFHHLREDLNDRARVRSGGKVRELVIQSLIVE